MFLQLTTTGAGSQSLQTLHGFLEAYQERRPGILFDVHNSEWAAAWHEQARIAISKTGAHISEVGAPWVSDFVAMSALRRFTAGEVEAAGGGSAFFPAPWSNVVISPSSLFTTGVQGTPTNIPSAPGVYALPGRVDVRVIYYWKDMLAKAGIDPAAAFSTPEQVEDTLERLRASGVPGTQNPWIYQSHLTRNWVYNMASWIWACGGDFMDEFGMPSFDQPKAIDGMATYFRLHRFMAPTREGETTEQVFTERRAAMMVFPTYYHGHLLRGEDVEGAALPNASELLSLLGAARLPGPAFVGGTCFVIWQHTPPAAARTAVDLLTRLLASTQMAEYCYGSYMLPAQVNGLYHPRVAADPFFAVMRASLESGRTNPPGGLWMPIADRLAAACKTISNELRRDPAQDVRALVERHVHALAKRLRMGMGST